MPDHSPSSSAWPVVCGVLALVVVISAAAAISLFIRLRDTLATQDSWQRRWQEDTVGIAEEMKVAGQKIADEAYARVKAENQIAALQAKIEDLTKALADAQRKANTPSPP